MNAWYVLLFGEKICEVDKPRSSLFKCLRAEWRIVLLQRLKFL